MAILRSAGRERVDQPLADENVARGRRVEPGDHSQERRLAAAGRPDQHDEFAVLDREVDVGEHAGRAIALVEFVDVQSRHARTYLTAPAVRPLISCREKIT